jgi:hypothetical protein
MQRHAQQQREREQRRARQAKHWHDEQRIAVAHERDQQHAWRRSIRRQRRAFRKQKQRRDGAYDPRDALLQPGGGGCGGGCSSPGGGGDDDDGGAAAPPASPRVRRPDSEPISDALRAALAGAHTAALRGAGMLEYELDVLRRQMDSAALRVRGREHAQRIVALESALPFRGTVPPPELCHLQTEEDVAAMAAHEHKSTSACGVAAQQLELLASDGAWGGAGYHSQRSLQSRQREMRCQMAARFGVVWPEPPQLQAMNAGEIETMAQEQAAFAGHKLAEHVRQMTWQSEAVAGSNANGSGGGSGPELQDVSTWITVQRRFAVCFEGIAPLSLGADYNLFR